MPPTLALHIGLHKTATTHLQQSLAQSRAALAAAGVALFTPPQLRQPGLSVAERLGLGTGRTGAAAVAALAEGAGRVVISDENLAGRLHDRTALVWPPYPDLADRAAALVAHVAPVPVALFVGLRAPGAFLVSAYSQLLVRGHPVPWEEVIAAHPPEAIDWPGRIAALAPVAPVTVWLQDDWPAVFPAVAAALVGAEAARVAGVAARPGRSQQGLSARAVAATLGGGMEARAARAAWPAGPDNPPFDPIPADRRAALAERWAADVARIAALPGVRLLRP